MKIVCDSCGAKYSIADEKVAGKVFKIRCKKCSAVIVVKGDNQDEGDEATRVYDYGAEAVWHVVVGGDQQGPLAPRQLGEMLAEGKIDWEAYVWREGMDGWQPAKDVETLVSAIMADAEGAPSPQAAQPAQSQLFGGSSDMGADPFASNDDGGLSGVMGESAAASGGGGDLFARSARSPFAGSVDDDEPMSNGHHGSPHVSEAESMTGQRNENSVLFSLSNLQALATGSGSTAAAPKSKAGMAQGEGSGLIDIRALASATQAVSSPVSNGASRDKVEDLMSVGAGGGGFSAAAFAAPVAVDKSDNSKLLMGGMAAAILLLGGVVGYLALRSPPAADPMAQAPMAAQAPLGAGQLPTAAAAAVAPTPVAPANAAPTAAAEAPAKASADEESGHEEKSGGGHRSGKHSAASSSESAAAAPAKPEKAEAAPAPAAPAKQSSADSSIDDLLSGALGGKAKPKPAAAAPADNLAATPSRDEVMTAMKSVTPKVQACGDGSGGVAQAKVTVAGATGRITSVEVNGPAQSCVTKEVSKAKFPKFSNSSFSFTYPFKL